jgi:hypothetical protein
MMRCGPGRTSPTPPGMGGPDWLPRQCCSRRGQPRLGGRVWLPPSLDRRLAVLVATAFYIVCRPPVLHCPFSYIIETLYRLACFTRISLFEPSKVLEHGRTNLSSAAPPASSVPTTLPSDSAHPLHENRTTATNQPSASGADEASLLGSYRPCDFFQHCCACKRFRWPLLHRRRKSRLVCCRSIEQTNYSSSETAVQDFGGAIAGEVPSKRLYRGNHGYHCVESVPSGSTVTVRNTQSALCLWSKLSGTSESNKIDESPKHTNVESSSPLWLSRLFTGHAHPT